MDYPKVGIVMVNYQDYAKRFLESSWQSLQQQTYPADKFKLYIVDNASSLESLNYLKQVCPSSRVISRQDGNYAAANNLGAKLAIEDGCELLVMANMDTVFDKYWLEELVKGSFEPGVGIVQSKVLLWSADLKQAKINTLGNDIHYLGFGLVSAYGQPDRELMGYPEIKGYASGCSLLIKKEVFTKIKGYQKEYYMYHDDLELSWKTKLVGYKVILAPLSVVYHKYEFSRSINMLYYMERNRLFTLFTFYQKRSLWLILPMLVIVELGLFLIALVKGWAKTKLKAWQYFCQSSNRLKVKQARREVQNLRQIKERVILSQFVSRLDFAQESSSVLKLANPLLAGYWRLVRLFI